jgi:toxin ParE1/3/4
LERILNKTAELKSNNIEGRPVPEFCNEKIRQLLIGPYRIIYNILNEDEVHILIVWHSSRKLPGLNELY